MTYENFVELLKGLHKIQAESFKDRSIVMWIVLNNYTQPTDIHMVIDVTLFIGGKKHQHSYSFFEGEDPRKVWDSLDDIHKRFRNRPVLRDLVKELKEKVIKG